MNKYEFVRTRLTPVLWECHEFINHATYNKDEKTNEETVTIWTDESEECGYTIEVTGMTIPQMTISVIEEITGIRNKKKGSVCK